MFFKAFFSPTFFSHNCFSKIQNFLPEFFGPEFFLLISWLRIYQNFLVLNFSSRILGYNSLPNFYKINSLIENYGAKIPYGKNSRSLKSHELIPRAKNSHGKILGGKN